MNPSRLLLAVTALALTLLFACASPAVAAAAAKPAPEPPVDERVLIKAVDATAHTVEIENMKNKSSHTYKIDDATIVKVNDSPAKFADIKAGMQVKESVERDDQALDSISVGPASAAPAAPATPKKKT